MVHSTGVRAQVFEVIVRQAIAGAPWREICAGPMQVNNITAEEVQAEGDSRMNLFQQVMPEEEKTLLSEHITKQWKQTAPTRTIFCECHPISRRPKLL